MHALARIVAMAVMLAASPAAALDATKVDIVGLRLGMADNEVVASMRDQGYTVTHDRQTLIVRTRDGQLAIDLSKNQMVRQIRYTLKGNGLGEREIIQDEMVGRFGPPNQAQPMAWCRPADHKAVCPDDRPLLTFLPDTLTMVLRAGNEPP